MQKSSIKYILQGPKQASQKQPPEGFCKKRCSQKFPKIHRKNLCQSLVFNKVAGPRPATLLKKRLWHSCFPVNFAKFLRTPFLQNTSGRLLLASENKRSNDSRKASIHYTQYNEPLYVVQEIQIFIIKFFINDTQRKSTLK